MMLIHGLKSIIALCFSLIYFTDAFTPQQQKLSASTGNHQHKNTSSRNSRNRSLCSSSQLIVRSSTSSSAEVTSSLLQDGIVKTIITKRGLENIDARRGDIATVKYSCYILDNGDEKIPFAKSNFQKVVVGDGTMIDAWDIGLKTMKVGERALFRITDPDLGYGSKGFDPIIPPNANIELDIELIDVTEPMATDVDFESLPFSDPLTPRTASSIAAAYDEKQRIKSLEPQKEGLEAWIEKAKNFYFFGFFEGETGEQAPWILRPSITFPIAFAIVGLAFYVSVIGGAISERGAPSTDELDELITMTTTASSTMVAMLLSPGNIDL